MSLYDDTNPAHLDQLDRWRAIGERYTQSRRGQPGYCPECGAVVDRDGECARLGGCLT